MSLRPHVELQLGSQRYASHARACTVQLGELPMPNRVDVLLPVDIDIRAGAGDEATLTLSNGERAHAVLSGRLDSVTRALDATHVTLTDAGTQLWRCRPVATYQQQSAAQMIQALAREAGVDVDVVDANLELASYVADQGRSAAEHVAYLAALAGGVAHVTAAGALQVRASPSRPDIALLHGRELLECRTSAGARPVAERVLAGSGPAGSSAAPDALRHTLDPLPGNATPPGTSARWQSAAVLRTPGAALSASNAATRRAAGKSDRMSARCFLLPAMRPGHVLELQQMPASVSEGPWHVTHVVHRLGRGHGESVVRAQRVSTGGAVGLASSGLSAAGGFA